MSNIEKMVNRFLGWKLPKDFAPDAGILFIPVKHHGYNTPFWPIGTNLLTAEQARQMFEFVTADDRDEVLQPHQQRVVTEKAELDEKIGKLFGFITSEKFAEIVPQDERNRLNIQYNIMVAYSKILEIRIAAFG